MSEKQISNLLTRRSAMEYGNALEKLVAQAVEGNELLGRFFRHAGKLKKGEKAAKGVGIEDWKGIGEMGGFFVDLTTEAAAKAHYKRGYLEKFLVLTYKAIWP